MVVQFAQWGNSLAVRIPAAIAKEIGASSGVAADVSVKDGKIIITPAKNRRKYSIAELIDEITPENCHAETGAGNAIGEEVIE